MSAEQRRLPYALLLSLLIHSVLLSLVFGGEGTGLPGFGFPWQKRRIEVPDLRLLLVPAPVTSAQPAVAPVVEPLPQASIEQPFASGPAQTPSVPPVPSPGRTALAIVSDANPTVEANRRTEAATGAAPAPSPLRANRPGDTAPPPIPAPAVIALARSDKVEWVVPAAPAMPAPAIAAESGALNPERAMPPLREAGDAAPGRVDQEAPERVAETAKLEPSNQEEQRQAEQLESARRDAVRQKEARVEAARLQVERKEAARQEAVRQDAIRQEATRVEAARLEAERQEAAWQETARLESERREAARQEATRQETAQQETARQEATRQEAARQEAARQEAARQAAALQEAARQEAARQEAARQEAARHEAARQEATRQEATRQEAAEKREAVLRAIGRQLDEEAARREPASAAARQLPSSSSARRGRLFGRTDPNAELVLYADAWSRKIELNMTFDMVREAAKQPHNIPFVTVAVRSDGSVESVTFVVSSGVVAIDEAIRRIVHSQTPYQAFPPGLAREYDVIEIRRAWHFDMAIRLF